MIETFTRHRQLLFGIAYRMLGSVSEAEDALQEVWLRWQKQDAAGVRSAKAWLVSATTRLCIDQLRSARRQRDEYYGIWLPEPLMISPDKSPDLAAEVGDSLTMAFMLMLESLGPDERAVFLLREIFDYDYAEVAEIVGKSEANCRQIVRRSKASLQTTPRQSTAPTEQARQLVELFLEAASTGKVEEVLALLTEQSAVYSDGGGKVKAAGRAIVGADRVSRFFLGIWPRGLAGMERQFVPINGGPGLLMSLKGVVHYAFSFELTGDRVKAVYLICNPDKLRHLTPVPIPQPRTGPAGP
ncbi:MAG: RNA polymerase sigma-70 factor [Opitutaceae bacterium]